MKKQTWILLMLVVVFAVIFWVSRTRTPVKRVSDYFVKIDSAAVQKVEIRHDTSDVLLEKRSDQWWVAKPVDYPANPMFGADLAGKVADLKYENLISEQPDKQSLFDVTDSAGIIVTVDAAGKAPVTFIMGKVDDSYRHTYMRMADSNKIYLVNGVFKSYFTRNVKDWRDKTIAKYDKNDFTKFVLQYPDKSMELTKEDTVWTAKIGKEEFVPQQNIVDRLINMAHNVQCFDFIDHIDTTKYDFSKPAFTLIATTTTDGYTIKLLPENKEASKYVVEKEGDPTHFVIYESTAKALMRDFDEFRPKKEEEAKSK
jgi:hypothetical protein